MRSTASRRRWLAGSGGAAALVASGCRLDSRFLYQPPTHDVSTWRAVVRGAGAEPIERVRDDGVRLRGGLVRGVGLPAGPAPLVMYFGGNAEAVSWMLGEVSWLTGVAFAAVDFRGFGASTGTPHETALHADAAALFDAFAARADVDPRRIVAWGRSLGTGVAVTLASRRPVAALVLTSPYDSIEALARHHLPWLAFLLGQPFDALSLAPRVRAPMLALVGGRDTVVPPAHSSRLVAAWGGPSELVRFEAAGHDDLHRAAGYRPAIASFVARVTR